MFPQVPEGFRSGFACFVGRPNAGKSTLTNALIGQKVAITSSRPQTTRHAIRGILHRPDAQLIVIDTPGLHSAQQVAAWRKVTDAVHAAGGTIFAQLMHTGRIGHPSLLPDGLVPVGPSPVAASGQ